jgi:hypothetical protein
MVLKVKWIDFKSQIDKHIIEGEALLEKYKSSRSEEEFTELKDAKQSWENDVIDFIKTSFEPVHINFAYDFKAQRGYNTGFKLGVDQRIKNIIQALNDEINGLDYYLKVLFISDAIIRAEEINLEERKNLDTEGRLDLILSKLYELYDDRLYHSIKWILEGNGVKLNNRGEDWDYAKMLENRGLVDTLTTKDTGARLTLEGKYAIEQARKAQVTDYTKISSSDEELKELIKQVLSEIEKLGYGQQIIFDEFDELREDIPHLDKKSIGQLLKAKLYDLVAQKAFDKTVASEIFKQFTDQILPF